MDFVQNYGFDEPRRFDVVEAMHAYNAISDTFLGPGWPHIGFFSKEAHRFQHRARKIRDLSASAYLFGLSESILTIRDIFSG